MDLGWNKSSKFTHLREGVITWSSGLWVMKKTKTVERKFICWKESYLLKGKLFSQSQSQSTVCFTDHDRGILVNSPHSNSSSYCPHSVYLVPMLYGEVHRNLTKNYVHQCKSTWRLFGLHQALMQGDKQCCIRLDTRNYQLMRRSTGRNTFSWCNIIHNVLLHDWEEDDGKRRSLSAMQLWGTD